MTRTKNPRPEESKALNKKRGKNVYEKNHALALTALTAVLATSPAYAYGIGNFFAPVSMPFQYALSGLSLSYGKLHQDYTEQAPSGSNAPNPLDGQHGNLHETELNFHALGSHWGLGLRLNKASGTTTYTGYLQNYNSSTGTITYTPITGKTDSTISNIAVRLRGGFSPIPQMAVVPDLIYGAHYWNRNLQGPGGYDEKYFNTFEGIGLTLAGSPIKSVVIQAGYEGGHTNNARMISSISPSTAHLGSKPWNRTTAQVDWTPWKHLTVFAAYSRTNFKYSQSGVIYTYSGRPVLEPNSTTHQTIERIGVKFHFL